LLGNASMLKPREQLGLLAITLLAMFFTAKVLKKNELKLPANAQGSGARSVGAHRTPGNEPHEFPFSNEEIVIYAKQYCDLQPAFSS